MKNILFTICLPLIMISVSCNKTDIQTNALSGKWNIINDTSSIHSDSFNEGSNYIGTSTDYYNFTPGGYLYIKEGSSFDTGKYSMQTNSQVQIIMFVQNGIGFGPSGAIRGTFDVTNLAAHTVTLTLSGLTPEGKELEIIKLKK